MNYYPIFLELKDHPVLVAGAGKVGLRKTRGLLEAGAGVTVVSPEALAEFDGLRVRLLRRRFRPSDLAGVSLVFATTNDRAVNHRIALLAKQRGILANIADSPAECDFIVPARVRKGNVQIAISTGGQNPRLSREIRVMLDSCKLV